MYNLVDVDLISMNVLDNVLVTSEEGYDFYVAFFNGENFYSLGVF